MQKILRLSGASVMSFMAYFQEAEYEDCGIIKLICLFFKEKLDISLSKN